MTALPPVVAYGVWLADRRVGALRQRGDYTWFLIDDAHREDPARPVLGLVFEQDLLARHAASLRLPPWFSNLLPEGRLREWIASDRGVKPVREMELLAHVGHDLPGAVRVVLDTYADGRVDADSQGTPPGPGDANRDDDAGTSGTQAWRFSLAGVALKFSMLREGDRLTLPAGGAGGDWIVKLPDARYADVPRNEYAMMRLAGLAGVEVPDVRLVHRDELTGLPTAAWSGSEEWAYAVRRFDRDEHRRPVHIEDLAQVRGVYPEREYDGNYETVAALVHRRRDLHALRQFARRLAFSMLIRNGDAHLKNWSLIYRDSRAPTLAPAYDLVSTAPYRPDPARPEDLALKLAGSRRFETVTVSAFVRVQRRLQATGADLEEHVVDVARRTAEHWPQVADVLEVNDGLREAIGAGIEEGRRRLLRART